MINKLFFRFFLFLKKYLFKRFRLFSEQTRCEWTTIEVINNAKTRREESCNKPYICDNSRSQYA